MLFWFEFVPLTVVKVCLYTVFQPFVTKFVLMAHVALLGHSHGRRMHGWMDSCKKEFNVQNVNVKFFVEGGLTVRRLLPKSGEHWLVDEMVRFCPQAVAVMLGDNDLSSGLTAAEVLCEFEGLMVRLKKLLNVERFVFFQVLPRGQDEEFMKKAHEFHEMLKEWAHGREGVLYFAYRDPRFSLTKHISSRYFRSNRDQVHLDIPGYRKLFSCVQFGLRSMARIWKL